MIEIKITGKDDSDNIKNECPEKYIECIQDVCPKCGCKGIIGVLKKEIPWYASNFMLIVYILSGIGIPIFIFMIFGGFINMKHTFECTNCKEIFNIK